MAVTPLTDPTVSDEASQRNFQALAGQAGKLAQLHFSGNGSPEGAVTAPKGAHYHRFDGGAGTCFYVHEGTGNTGWVAK